MNAIDIGGKRFGRWLALHRVPQPNQFGKLLWTCVCDCGTKRDVVGSTLKSGISTSCGCKRDESVSKVNASHGCSGTKTHRVWKGMIQRCTNPKNHKYPLYGGRGIEVCERWRKSFANFLSDMGEAPYAMSIDRIDVNGNYEPSNCRWATALQQARNTRRSLAKLERSVRLEVK